MTGQIVPDHEYLTVRELADLLRLKERKVYDLAATGKVPCSRATGKLLFPAAEIRAWIQNAKSGGGAVAVERPAVFLGSHDPLLDWAIRQSQCGLATFFDGSLDGLDRFVAGEGVAAGVHICDAATSGWNVPAVSEAAAAQNAVLISFATRSRGLVFSGDRHSPKGIADIAGLRVVPRQPQSGTAGLFKQLAEAEGLDLSQVAFSDIARTEDDAVESVRRGEADVAFGLMSVAKGYGLDFLPLVEEEFSLVVDRKAWFDRPMRTLMAFCDSDSFRQRAQSYSGYDVSNFGTVLWNA